MNRFNKKHAKVLKRELAYKASRRLADQAFKYKHQPRWRKVTKAMTKSTRQTKYGTFGPSFFKAVRRRFRWR